MIDRRSRRPGAARVIGAWTIALGMGLVGAIGWGDRAVAAGMTRSPQFPTGDRLSQTTSPPSETQLPFIGQRYFNFLGGTGTGYSIDIEPDGTTTVQLHGTAGSAIEYRGRFSNPLFLSNDRALRIEGNTIYQTAADGRIDPSCITGNSPCKAQLYDITTDLPNESGASSSSNSGGSLPPDEGFNHDDDRFIRQSFNAALFRQVRQINQQNGCFDLPSPCPVRIYSFRDLSLITKLNGTESVDYSLTFYRPISLRRAMTYAQILAGGELLRPATAEHQIDRLVYRGCPYDAGSSEPAMLCVAQLLLGPNRQVSGIAFSHSSP